MHVFNHNSMLSAQCRRRETTVLRHLPSLMRPLLRLVPRASQPSLTTGPGVSAEPAALMLQVPLHQPHVTAEQIMARLPVASDGAMAAPVRVRLAHAFPDAMPCARVHRSCQRLRVAELAACSFSVTACICRTILTSDLLLTRTIRDLQTRTVFSAWAQGKGLVVLHCPVQPPLPHFPS